MLEMIVVVAIIAIIAVLVMARVRQGQKLYALSGAAQRLSADIREAQAMAVAGVETQGHATIAGYGIYIEDANSYSVFLTDAMTAQKCPSGAITKIKTIDLAEEVQITAVKVNNFFVPVATNPNVFFTPPEPKTCINGDSVNNTTMEITLSREGNNRTVSITTYGKIDSQ